VKEEIVIKLKEEIKPEPKIIIKPAEEESKSVLV